MTELLGHHPWTRILARGSRLVCPPGCVSCRQENRALPAPTSLTPQLPCTHRSASSGLRSPPDGDPSSVAFPAVLRGDAPVAPPLTSSNSTAPGPAPGLLHATMPERPHRAEPVPAQGSPPLIPGGRSFCSSALCSVSQDPKPPPPHLVLHPRSLHQRRPPHLGTPIHPPTHTSFFPRTSLIPWGPGLLRGRHDRP